MFRVRVPYPEVYQSMTRPFILKSLRKALDYFDMNRNVEIYFSGENEVSNLLGTSFDSKRKDSKDTNVGFNNKLYIEFDVSEAGYNDELDNSHRQSTTDPYWFDPKTGTAIRPLFENKLITVTINRYFKDRYSAKAFTERMKTTLRNPYNAAFSSIVHFPLSYSILELLESTYDRLVNAGQINPNELNALEWIKQNSVVPWDILANFAGNNACYVFKRSIEDNELIFEHPRVNMNVAQGAYHGQYLLSFTYKFYYAEPTQWEVHYPIMVYQQMTPVEYIPQVDIENLNDYPVSRFYEYDMISRLTKVNSFKNPFMFVFPKEDNYRTPGEHWLEEQLQRLAFVEDIDEQEVLNLLTFKDLDDFWDPTFVKYIKQFNNKLIIRHRNPMHVKVWSQDVQIEENQLTLNEEGIITLLRRPTMRNEHRVVFYLDMNINLYDDECIKDILDDEDYGRWIIDKIIPELPLPGDPGYIGDTKPGDVPWLNWDKDVLDKVDRGETGDKSSRGPHYMMSSSLIARNEQYKTRQPFEGIVDPRYTMTEYLRRK